VQLTVQAIQIAQTAIYQGQTQTVIAQHFRRTWQPHSKPLPLLRPPGTQPCNPHTRNLPKFQSETVPDGTQMDAGQHFAKHGVKNIGSCTWTRELPPGVRFRRQNGRSCFSA
jgi:hypothetical protein